MREKIIIAALVFVIGVSSGTKLAEIRHNKAMAKAAAELEAAQAEKREQLAKLSKEYYEQLEAINNRDPVVVERRVHVKTDCVPAGASTGLGDAPNAGGAGANGTAVGGSGKVELAQETVQAVAGVADRAERLYQQCVTRLKYFQARHAH